jgi:hypothetical protein
VIPDSGWWDRAKVPPRPPLIDGLGVGQRLAASYSLYSQAPASEARIISTKAQSTASAIKPVGKTPIATQPRRLLTYARNQTVRPA